MYNHYCTTVIRHCLQSNSAVCLCKQDQGGVIVEVLHPDPRTAHSHELIEMLDCEVEALLRLDAVLATEAALGLRISNHDAKACDHQPVHLCQTHKQ